MITALIFDCYGVLTTDAWQPFKQEHFGANKTLHEQASDLNKQTNAGLLSYEDFLQQVGEMASLPADEVRRAIEGNAVNEPLFALINRLKSKYKIGMLSNAADNWLNDLFRTEHVALFDAVALSYEMGVIKPDVRAYEVIAERLGVDAAQCVFIDDQERFCTAARDAGMQAIWYQNFEQCVADLAALGVSTR